MADLRVFELVDIDYRYDDEAMVVVAPPRAGQPRCGLCGWFMAKVAGGWRCGNDIDVYRDGSYYGREHR